MFGFFSQTAPIARVQLPDASFNYQTPVHIDIINKRIERFKQAQTALHSLDRNIVVSWMLGSACWVGAYVFPLVTASIVSFCYSTHCLTRRPECFRQYKEALDDLIAVYKWSMGKEMGNHWYKLGEESIQTLIETLGPWVSKETIYTWQDKDLAPSSVLSLARRNEPKESFKIKLTLFAEGKQTENWQFPLYGENGIDDLMGTVQAYFKREAKEAVEKHAKEAVASFLK